MGTPGVEWSFGDVDAGMAAAALVLDESFVTAALSHHCLETGCAVRTGQDGARSDRDVDALLESHAGAGGGHRDRGWR
jgi:hypothetical protein